MSATQTPQLCPDWVISIMSNVHATKDRGWFKTYTPYSSTTLNGSEVLGIGSVEIPTKRDPNLSGPESNGIVYLKEVLHVPSLRYNILGQPLVGSDGYKVKWGRAADTKSKGSINEKVGGPVAYFDPKQDLFIPKLALPPIGPVVGPSAFDEGLHVAISCNWDDQEMKKWKAYKVKNGLDEAETGATGQSASAIDNPAPTVNATSAAPEPATEQPNADNESDDGTPMRLASFGRVSATQEENQDSISDVLETAAVDQTARDT